MNPNNTLKWEFFVESGYVASSPPIVGGDGTVYCGFYNSGASYGRLYAINPNGTEKWHFQVNSEVNTPAIDGNGAIIFGVPNPVNMVYALNSNGTQKWASMVIGGGYFSECYVYSPPVIGLDGTIYISSNRRLTALNPTTGATKWGHNNGVALVETDYANGPVIDSNGIVYYGSLGVYGSGTLYAIDTVGLRVAWSYDVGSGIASQPIITANGNVVFGTADWSSVRVVAIKGGGTLAQSPWPSARQNPANTASQQDAYFQASLFIGMTASPYAVAAGGSLTFNVTVENYGPNLAPALVITNGLPGNASFVAASTSQGSYSKTGNNLIWNLGSLDKDAAAALQITVSCAATGVVSNAASLSGRFFGNPYPTNCSASGIVVSSLHDITITSLSQKSSFVPGKLEQAKLKATFALPASFSPTNVWATLNVGGVSLDFWLNAKGKGTNGFSKVNLKVKDGIGTISATLKGDWEEEWFDEGLTNETVANKPVAVPVVIMFNSSLVEAFTASKSMLYKATQGKSGSAK